VADYTGDPEPLLEEIKERYAYGCQEWKEIRDEGALNMKYVAGDPWEKKARAARVEASRPVLTSDELGQYVNQTINDLRANKRGIKVTPTGFGANDRTAAWRQGKIRDIEYRSNAQQAYTQGGADAIQRNVGYWRIKAKYVSAERGFDQEPCIEPVVNPDLVTPDPDFVRPDGSDWKWLFFEESRSEKEFSRAWPDARVKSFTIDHIKLAPTWVTGSRVRIAEYWKLEVGRTRRWLQLKPGPASAQDPTPQPFEIFEDELAPGTVLTSDRILKVRKVDEIKVCQYVTNGVEILEHNVFPGPSIPFIACYGKILYLDEGGGPKRKILSMISLARDPYMLYCYYLTQQAEMAGMVPKVPVVGYKGQFAGVEDDWQRAPHVPLAFIEALAKTPATGDAILALPTRLAYDAGQHLQALELCREGARRAIQAAMAMSPLPTSAQRHNEKSGVALKQIEDSGQKGTFHFVDSYDGGVCRTGTILNGCLKFFYDTAREDSIRKPDDSVEMVYINDPDRRDEDDRDISVDTQTGSHDVTVSVGPAIESERDAASQFADAVINSKEIMAVAGPQKAAEIFAAAIRLKNVGPIGDAMAEIISPKKQDQGDPKQQLRQAEQEIQKLQQQVQELGNAVTIAADEKRAKKVEVESREKIAGMEMAGKVHMADAAADVQLALQVMKDATTIAVAHIQAAAKGGDLNAHAAEEIAALNQETDQAAADRTHEINMSALTHLQSMELGAQGAVQDANAADQAQAHTLEESEQGAEQDAAAADQGQAHALEQGEQAAALAPEPAAPEA
jgi:hypothetical protein